MKQNYLLCGKVVNTHGVRGALKVEHYCDSSEIFAAIKTVFLKKGEEYAPYPVRRAVRFGRMMLLELEGVNSLETAVDFKNRELFAKREDIPIGEHAVFLSDLFGAPVVDANTGRVYGSVLDIQESPAAHLFVVKTEDGKEVLLPDVPAFIKSADSEKGLMITPIEGFFS